MKKIISMLLILMISGCVGMPDISGILGGSQKSKVKEQPPDVIVIQNVNTLPAPPINAGDQFSISFEVNNQEEERDVEYVAYKLLDSGLCTWNSSSPKEDTFTKNGEVFVPKQTEFVEWTFDTPNAADLAYISSKCPVRFKVNYTFEAISEIEVDVISQLKYSQLQQSGEFKTFTPTLTIGRGPIKIYMEFGATQPIKTGTTLPVYITVQDKGTGLYSEIPKESLIIKVPEDFEGDCGDRFNDFFIDGDTKKYNNSQPIMMIGRKSPTFRCSFTTPTSVSVEKIFNIDASLNYTYDLTKQVDVGIKAPSGI
jgi:hypothetical protein